MSEATLLENSNGVETLLGPRENVKTVSSATLMPRFLP